jgi:predicted DsbA family dithiol-disulfide isomerase
MVTNERTQMRIDVFQDPACPWCRIGKRHLQLALDQWQGPSVEVRFRAYMLDPTIPPEGRAFREYMTNKGGGRMLPEQFFAAPREMGQAAGLRFNFEAIERAPNTLLAQRLVVLVPSAVQSDVLDAIYAAYFEHGQNIGDLDTLVEIAGVHGLDQTEIRGQLEGNAGRQEVVDDLEFAQDVGIRGVPFFIFEDRFAVSGAQPPEVLLQIMRQVTDGTIEQDVQ